MTANEEQAKFWSARAASWLEAEWRLQLVSAGPGAAAMARLPLRPGYTVIDVGCGAGRTTVELAGLVSPGGRAVGMDIASEMVAYAAAHAGAAAVEFVTGDAQDIDLGTKRFDAAYSRFGVMFFSDPVRAFSNVRVALRDGGVLAFACWRAVFENEWMLVPGAAAQAITDARLPLPAPGEPGPFSLADPDRLRSMLMQAGFAQVEVDTFSEPVVVPTTDIADFAEQTTHAGAVREILEGADDETRRTVLTAIEEALAARAEGGEVRLSRSANIVTAR